MTLHVGMFRRCAATLVALVVVVGTLAACRVQEAGGQATAAPAATAVPAATAPASGSAAATSVATAAATSIEASPSASPATAASTPAPVPTASPTTESRVTAVATATAPAAAAIASTTTPAAATSPLATQGAATPEAASSPAATPGAAASTCASPPVRGFGLVWASHTEVPGLLGCPAGAEAAIGVVFEQFEHGWMVQVGASGQAQAGSKTIYVLYSDTGSLDAVPDTWVAGTDPVSTGQTPPAGLVEPRRDFGKVWRDGSGVRARLGWAIAAERGANGAWQPFQHGQMVWTPDPKQIFVLGRQAPAAGAPNVWRVYPDLFAG